MNIIGKISHVSEFNSERGQETLHPLVSVLDQSKSDKIQAKRYLSDLFIIFLKDIKCEDFQYGRNSYDYQEESLIFIAPGQIFGMESQEKRLIKPNGWALAFHPDFIKGSSLGKKIHEYHFFNYTSREALHISKKERKTIVACLLKIIDELEQGIDKHSKTLIINNIELLLNYCVRYYDRQFITREIQNKNILVQFEELLHQYFASESQTKLGIPSVAYFAEKLNLSTNYFGDLIKKETGQTALEFIQSKILDLAKEKMFDPNKSISEIAYEVGYHYPHHFSRLFKDKIGISPSDYRKTL